MVKRIPVETDDATGRRFKRRKDGGRFFLCEHDRKPTRCREGQCIKRFKDRTREKCPCGSSITLMACRNCDTPGAGAMYCPNTGIKKSVCRCENSRCGSGFCKHGKRRSICPDCDKVGWISHNVRSRCTEALKGAKNKSTVEYLDCTYEFFRKHLEKTFQPSMSWDNQKEWQIGHRKPLREKGISEEETMRRLHYSNTFAQWTADNQRQGNRFHWTEY